MIIYGYKNREVEGGAGIFTCPNCNEQRVYKYMKVIRYFTLFFIQLFPLGKVNEYIQCQFCQRNYSTTVISVEAIKSLRTTEQKKSNLALATIFVFLGTIGLLLGCITGFILVAFQIDNPDNWEGFLGLMALCPMPLIAFGVISLVIGLRGRQTDETINDGQGYSE